jgi:hypothetical protein
LAWVSECLWKFKIKSYVKACLRISTPAVPQGSPPEVRVGAAFFLSKWSLHLRPSVCYSNSPCIHPPASLLLIDAENATIGQLFHAAGSQKLFSKVWQAKAVYYEFSALYTFKGCKRKWASVVITSRGSRVWIPWFSSMFW